MGNKERVEAIFPKATVDVYQPYGRGGFRWKVTTDYPTTLKALRELEALIGHDAIRLCPAEYESDYSDETPGAGFVQGYVEFDWKEGA